MSIHRALLLFGLLGAVVALVAGCGSSNSDSSSSSSGSGSNLSQGTVATVGDTNITQAQLDQILKSVEQAYKSRKTTFPAAGSPQYKQIQDKALELLVQREEYSQKAKALGVVVTNKQLNDRMDQIKKQYFGGSDKRYRAGLKQQGFTDQQVRDDQRSALISDALIARAGLSAKVPLSEIRAYYDQHTQNYSTPQTRVVRHILVKSKSLADKLYKQVVAGANFAALAKKYSIDPGTRSLGGELTITRGLTVKPFDTAAFSLRTGQVSKPVHSQYGWHIIKAEKPAKPRQVTPFAKVEAAIRQQLIQQKRSKATSDWVSAVTKEFCSGKLEFAKGFTPDPDPCATTK
jgi:parvulin-like peptidyl-prolyl isomerase